MLSWGSVMTSNMASSRLLTYNYLLQNCNSECSYHGNHTSNTSKNKGVDQNAYMDRLYRASVVCMMQQMLSFL